MLNQHKKMAQVSFLPVMEGSREPIQPPTCVVHTGEKTVARHSLLTHQLRDLSKTLVFADDALFALASIPAPCTYASSHQSNRQLFDYQTISVPMTHRRRRVSKVGRHNTRGSGSKHLPCHLTQSLPFVLREEPGVGRAREDWLTSKGTMEDQDWQWEAREGQLTSTAHQHRANKAHKDQLSPISLDQDREHSAKAKEVSTVSLVADSKAFVAQLAVGAKPLHLLQGRDSTILLDNNTLFKKVLQPKYPLPPSEYHADKAAKKTSTLEVTSDRPVSYLQGQRRWLGLPRLIEVSKTSEIFNKCIIFVVFFAALCGYAMGVHEYW